MLFNSIDFAIFLPIVFILYWAIPIGKIRIKNSFLLVASYVFYGWWDYRFLSLIILSSLVDYLVGIRIQKATNLYKKRLLLFASVFTNLGILGFFKYSNFFIENFQNAFSVFGYNLSLGTMQIILPVGISFYTFQTMSYSIDIYKGKMQATDDIIAFFSYVAFFPQLVAGPIERAKNLLPQFYYEKRFDYFLVKTGLRQMLWGLFKKIVIADNCATFVEKIFTDYTSYSSVTLIIAAFVFSFQIYCDFSGYSDIAIGVAKLFGFNLRKNFAFPYFSRDVAEFWRRWHISLSSWFKDYVYIPLGGSRGSKVLQIRNTFIIFLLSGFWHGAKWNFIVWGIIHAILFLPLLLIGQNRKNITVASVSLLPSFKDSVNILFTFTLVTFAWIFFRASSLPLAIDYFYHIFIFPPSGVVTLIPFKLFIPILLLIFIEWINRDKEFGLSINWLIRNKKVRWMSYFFLLFLIIFYVNKGENFIYFQF